MAARSDAAPETMPHLWRTNPQRPLPSLHKPKQPQTKEKTMNLNTETTITLTLDEAEQLFDLASVTSDRTMPEATTLATLGLTLRNAGIHDTCDHILAERDTVEGFPITNTQRNTIQELLRH